VTPSEAAELLAYAGSLDNRKPSLAAAKAWSDALGDIPLDQDTLAAVARYYSMPASDDPNDKRWIQPHHVRFHRAKIREPRIDAAHPVYSGQPTETGIESGINIRVLNDDAGSGRIPPRSIEQAIQPGADRSYLTPRIKAMIANIAQEVPDSEQPEIGVNARGVRCPICHVEPGKSCTSRRKRHHAEVHPARLEDARRAAEGRPPIDRARLATEEEQRRIAALALLGTDGPSTFVPPGRDGIKPWNPKTELAEASE
jgi:hypothetical protein